MIVFLRHHWRGAGVFVSEYMELTKAGLNEGEGGGIAGFASDQFHLTVVSFSKMEVLLWCR